MAAGRAAQATRSVKTKRGTAGERGLAYAGIALWAAWGLLWVPAPSDYILLGISVVAVIMGVREIRRWQAQPQSPSGGSTRKPVYPRWAWFGVGALPATAVVEFLDFLSWDATTGAAGGLYVPGVVAWVVGGFGTEAVLVWRARRRERFDRQATASTTTPPEAAAAGPAPEVPRPAAWARDGSDGPLEATPEQRTSRTDVEERIDVGQWVPALTFSPDGHSIATASRRRVRVWDASAKHMVWEQSIGGWTNDVTGVAWSPDGARIVTADMDGDIKLWDAASGEQLLQVRHDDSLEAVAFGPDGRRIATASDDGSAAVWDATDGARLLVVRHGKTVLGVDFSPDGTRLVTASQDKTARVWDVATGKQLLNVRHGGAVNGAVFAPDGRRIATASEDGSFVVWDATLGSQLLNVHNTSMDEDTEPGSGDADEVTVDVEELLDVAFSPGGERLATASLDGRAIVWDAATGQKEFTAYHDRGVLAVAFSPNGACLASAGTDKTVLLTPLTPTAHSYGQV